MFYFRPQKRWYLIFQYGDGDKDRPRKPGFSTNPNIEKWQAWTKPAPLFDEPGEMVDNWIDFWVICDEAKAHLFFTSDNGAHVALGREDRGLSTRLEQAGAGDFRATSLRPATPTGCTEPSSI